MVGAVSVRIIEITIAVNDCLITFTFLKVRPSAPVSVCLFLSLLHWGCTVYNVNLLSNLNLCTFKLKRLNKVNFQHGVKRSDVHLNFPPNLTSEIERDQADGGKAST